MKVIITYEDDSAREFEAENSYHAHNIMFYAFHLSNVKEDKNHVKTLNKAIRASCPEIDAEFYLKDNEVIMRATDMDWVTEMQEKEKGR